MIIIFLLFPHNQTLLRIQVHTSLVNGRPGFAGPSEALLKFTEARYVRLRLQKIRTLHGDLQGRSSEADASVTKLVPEANNNKNKKYCD